MRAGPTPSTHVGLTPARLGWPDHARAKGCRALHTPGAGIAANRASLQSSSHAPACRGPSTVDGTTERACYSRILNVDSQFGRHRQTQNAALRTPPIIEKDELDAASSPYLCFDVRTARPQNSGGGSREIRADFPSETARNIFEFPRPLAQKQPPPAQRLDKIIPRLAKNQQNSSRKSTPSFGKNRPKMKNSFSRATPQNSPAPYIGLSRLTGWPLFNPEPTATGVGSGTVAVGSRLNDNGPVRSSRHAPACRARRRRVMQRPSAAAIARGPVGLGG